MKRQAHRGALDPVKPVRVSLLHQPGLVHGECLDSASSSDQATREQVEAAMAHDNDRPLDISKLAVEVRALLD